MADTYECLVEQPNALLTIHDPHEDHCSPACKSHKHDRREVQYGETFDLADIYPKNTNVDVLINSGLIRKAEARSAADKATKKDG
jgi:hypothetical protein